jgi:serine/threonine protein kinase
MTSNSHIPDSSNNPSNDKQTASSVSYQIPRPEPGMKIGHNKIIELIAEGGMASVYKVWHEELEIVRAIKILKPGFDEETKKRLRTEAKISAHLSHPNIVEIYGLYFWNDYIPYIEMEYVDGFSLRQLIDSKKVLPLTFSLSLIYFICNALHYAHNQVFTLYGKTYEGIVHRDIKPANILITRSGTPKLADFGIARPKEISIHTDGQKVMGTFTYLSPEQLNGEPLDRRSDIYSLGTVLYECIIGVKAFPQKMLTDLIREKLQNNYTPIDSFGIEIPKKCAQIIEKSMQLEKEKRYQTSKEMADDILEFIKKTTTETPDQILSSFNLEQSDITKIKLKTKNKFPFLNLFLVPFIAFAILITIFLALNFQKSNKSQIKTSLSKPTTLEKKAYSTQEDISKESITHTNVVRDSQISSKDFSNISTPITKDMPVNKITSNKKTITSSSNINDASNVLSSSATLNEKTINIARSLSEASENIKSKRWSNAINILERLLKQSLSEQEKTQAIILLLESYLQLNDLESAKKIVIENTNIINDGLFFLLSGELYNKIDMQAEALSAFSKAQKTPSKFKKTVDMEATLNIARIFNNFYHAKPNIENKILLKKAYLEFKNNYCPNTSIQKACEEAEEILSNLGEN